MAGSDRADLRDKIKHSNPKIQHSARKAAGFFRFRGPAGPVFALSVVFGVCFGRFRRLLLPLFAEDVQVGQQRVAAVEHRKFQQE